MVLCKYIYRVMDVTNRVARHGMYHQKQWTVAECHPAYPSMSPLTATTPTLTQLFLQARTPFLRSDSAR